MSRETERDSAFSMGRKMQAMAMATRRSKSSRNLEAEEQESLTAISADANLRGQGLKCASSSSPWPSKSPIQTCLSDALALKPSTFARFSLAPFSLARFSHLPNTHSLSLSKFS